MTLDLQTCSNILTQAQNLLEIIDSSLGKMPIATTWMFIISIALYTLWTAHNHFIFREIPIQTPPFIIILHASESIQGFQRCISSGKNTTTSLKHLPSSHPCWTRAKNLTITKGHLYVQELGRIFFYFIIYSAFCTPCQCCNLQLLLILSAQLYHSTICNSSWEHLPDASHL